MGAFAAMHIVFNNLFIVELLMRLLAGKLNALKSAWIWFDAILIVFGVLEWVGISGFGVDPNIMRVVRLARMLRALKIVKVIRAFDSLYLLIRSIQASVGALVWSFVLLVFIQISCGLVLSHLLGDYINTPNEPIDTRHLVF